MRSPAPNAFSMVLTLEDGYELTAGHISDHTGADATISWTWSCLGERGEAKNRADAIRAFQDAWDDVSKDNVADFRLQQELRTKSAH